MHARVPSRCSRPGRGCRWCRDATHARGTGLHVPLAERVARSQSFAARNGTGAGAGAGGVARSRAGSRAAAARDQHQVRSSHLWHHTAYPSEASTLFNLLPDEYAPHWLFAPVLSRFLHRVALLCIAEVSVHAVHVVMISQCVDLIVLGAYMILVMGKGLLTLHQCLFCGELLPLSRYSFFALQRLEEQSAVVYPLQSAVISLLKRGCIWSILLLGMVAGVIPYIGFRSADLLPDAHVAAAAKVFPAWSSSYSYASSSTSFDASSSASGNDLPGTSTAAPAPATYKDASGVTSSPWAQAVDFGFFSGSSAGQKASTAGASTDGRVGAGGEGTRPDPSGASAGGARGGGRGSGSGGGPHVTHVFDLLYLSMFCASLSFLTLAAQVSALFQL